eukprot:3006726-Alexandrium_andersonii.AAC.1
MADCGFRRIAVLEGFERIADCTLDALPCKDPKLQMRARVLADCSAPLRRCERYFVQRSASVDSRWTR